MANHGWLSTKKFMTHEGLTKDLNELNETLFRSVFEVRPYSNPEPHEDIIPHENRPKIRPEQGFEIVYKGETICLFWMNSRRRLEFRHHYYPWSWWVESQIESFLGEKYDGWLTDEGIPDRWRPEGSRLYPNVKAWLERRFSERIPAITRRMLVRLELASVPKEIRELSTDGRPHGKVAWLRLVPSLSRGRTSRSHRRSAGRSDS